MAFSERKFPAAVFLTLMLALAMPSVVYAQPPQTHALESSPEVYIYYAGFLSRHFCCDGSQIDDLQYLDGNKAWPSSICCDIRKIDDLQNLDGTNDWRSLNIVGKECLLRPPKSNEIYEALLPYLSRAKEGLFSGNAIFKIVNKTTGKDTYVDRDGGMFTPGERITRQISLDDFNAIRVIMDGSGCNEKLEMH